MGGTCSVREEPSITVLAVSRQTSTLTSRSGVKGGLAFFAGPFIEDPRRRGGSSIIAFDEATASS